MIRDNEALSRFELDHEGHIAFSEYRRSPRVITFTHTVVPKELSGRGVGSTLIKAALDEVRRQGLKVVAECPFVAAFIAKHPDYADLLSQG
jgi:predicted GNAT family acetyltransferase